MKRLTAYLLGMAALALVMLLAPLAQAQSVTDKPITTWPDDWTGVVWSIDLAGQAGCIAGWGAAPDRYSSPPLQIAFARMPAAPQELSDAISAKSHSRLAAARTVNLRAADANGVMRIHPAAQPCYAKLEVPAAAWVVAKSTTGKRPAYLLNADGTLGKQAGTVDVKVTGNGKTVDNRCNCRVRAQQTTSTYCMPAWFSFPSTEAAPMPDRVVTLCRRPS